MKIETVDHISIDVDLPNGDKAVLSIIWNPDLESIIDISYRLEVKNE